MLTAVVAINENSCPWIEIKRFVVPAKCEQFLKISLQQLFSGARLLAIICMRLGDKFKVADVSWLLK